jgi:hypothetical protein
MRLDPIIEIVLLMHQLVLSMHNYNHTQICLKHSTHTSTLLGLVLKELNSNYLDCLDRLIVPQAPLLILLPGLLFELF